MRQLIVLCEMEEAAPPLDDWSAGDLVWVKPRQADAAVLVNVAKLDKAWSKDTGFYIGYGGTGHAIGNRYNRFREFLATGHPVEMAYVTYDADHDRIGFSNGRHRFAVLRDLGIHEMPVAVDHEQVKEFRRHFSPNYAGSSSR